MKLGVYQFASTESINSNLDIISKAIHMAAANEITLLVFHECALCGYPPIENKLENIDPRMVEYALKPSLL